MYFTIPLIMFSYKYQTSHFHQLWNFKIVHQFHIIFLNTYKNSAAIYLKYDGNIIIQNSTPNPQSLAHNPLQLYICITEANNAILPNSIILFLALLNGAEESSKAGVVGRLSTNRTSLTESHLILKRDIESLFQVWSKKFFSVKSISRKFS